jgi:hypothetical protein
LLCYKTSGLPEKFGNQGKTKFGRIDHRSGSKSKQKWLIILVFVNMLRKNVQICFYKGLIKQMSSVMFNHHHVYVQKGPPTDIKKNPLKANLLRELN